VAIFDDMLEVTSPGPLPDTLPVEELGTGRSEIRNRVLAPIFKDLKLIEAWGTGIRKMRNEVSNYPEIELVLQEAGHAFQVQFKKKAKVGEKLAGQVTDKCRTSAGQVPDKLKFLDYCRKERSIKEMMAFLQLKHRETFSKNYIYPLLQDELLTMTIPDKPRSPKQRYIITTKGLKELKKTSP
jgi:ATP-dependent DNA helicase RecG